MSGPRGTRTENDRKHATCSVIIHSGGGIRGQKSCTDRRQTKNRSRPLRRSHRHSPGPCGLLRRSYDRRRPQSASLRTSGPVARPPGGAAERSSEHRRRARYKDKNTQHTSPALGTLGPRVTNMLFLMERSVRRGASFATRECFHRRTRRYMRDSREVSVKGWEVRGRRKRTVNQKRREEPTATQSGTPGGQECAGYTGKRADLRVTGSKLQVKIALLCAPARVLSFSRAM